MKCPMCNSSLKKGMVKEEYLGHPLGEFEGYICNKCGETLLAQESVEAAQTKAKQLGIFGLAEKTNISKSGNSLILRLKKKLTDYIGVSEGSEVLVHPEGKHKLVIEVI